MKCMNKKFEPTIVPPRYMIESHLQHDWPDFKWSSFNKYDHRKFNESVIGNVFKKLHYMCYHSTSSNRTKYNSALNRFEKHHFGDIYKQSMYFSNKFTANRFL